jgi:hypothetical protein
MPAIAPALKSIPPSAPAGAVAPQCGIGQPVKPGCDGSVMTELEDISDAKTGSYELHHQPYVSTHTVELWHHLRDILTSDERCWCHVDWRCAFGRVSSGELLSES